MSEDRHARSWLDRIGQALSGEPQDRDELVEVLRDAEKRGLLNADVLAIVDRDLRYLAVNEAVAAANGLPAPDHVGKDLRDVLPEAPQVLF